MNLIEEFKEIEGFPNYEISNCGRVRTKSRKIRYVHAVTGREHYRQSQERYLKLFQNACGYKFVSLRNAGKATPITVHRLVALNFIPNIDKLRVVNHKDGNKHNNCLSNLEWCTDEYNHRHATETGLKASGERVGTSVLNSKCILAIRKLLKMGWSQGEIANLFEVSRPAINLINTGKTWSHIPHTLK